MKNTYIIVNIYFSYSYINLSCFWLWIPFQQPRNTNPFLNFPRFVNYAYAFYAAAVHRKFRERGRKRPVGLNVSGGTLYLDALSAQMVGFSVRFCTHEVVNRGFTLFPAQLIGARDPTIFAFKRNIVHEWARILDIVAEIARIHWDKGEASIVGNYRFFGHRALRV